MARELLQALPPSVADVLGADGVFGDATDCKTAVVTVEGRVTRKKWFSSRLFFFDVSGASVDPDAFVGEKLLSAARLACIYRQGAQHDRGILGAADVVELSSQFELGDYVRVQYSPQSQKTAERSVQVRRLEVLRAWRHSHGDEPALDTDTAPVVTDPNTRRAPKGEVCKFWVNSGRCPLRACKLKHVPEEERKAARDAWQAQRRLEREETQRRQAAAIGDNFEAGGHKKQHKKNRAAIFCSWLVHTFGLERLKQGSGVLDVAGGKGEVARKLQELGVKCRVIDPRQQAHKESLRWRDQSHEQIAECFDEALWRSEEHAQVLRDCSLLVGMHPDQATEPLVDFAIAHKKPFAVVPCCVFPRLHLHRRTAPAGGAPWKEERVAEVRSREAADHAADGGLDQVAAGVDIAQEETELGERKTAEERQEGKAASVGHSQGSDLVITYEDFLAFLAKKHQNVRQTCLGFKGRNAVLHVLDYGEGKG